MDVDGTRVLVTGANGFVGGRVARRLLDGGAEVRAIVRRPGTAPDGCDEVVGDFTEQAVVAGALDGVDAVVHCAATAGEDLEHVRHVNTEGTRSVVEAMLERDVHRLVHISTAGVYERQADVVDESTPLVTDGPPYSLTKREAEDVVRAGAERGLTVTILRPPAILGWSETSTWGQRFPAWVRDGELPFTPNPDTTHVWVHVDDLADVVARSLPDERTHGEAFDVIGGNGTWREYIDRIRGFVDTDVDPFDGERPEAWTGRFTGRKLRDTLGWAPTRSFDDGMFEAARAFAKD